MIAFQEATIDRNGLEEHNGSGRVGALDEERGETEESGEVRVHFILKGVNHRG